MNTQLNEARVFLQHLYDLEKTTDDYQALDLLSEAIASAEIDLMLLQDCTDL